MQMITGVDDITDPDLTERDNSTMLVGPSVASYIGDSNPIMSGTA